MVAVSVNERDALSYYPHVEGGPIEAGYLTIQGVGFVAYVNAKYGAFDESMINPRASALFEMAGVGMWGGFVRGSALLVLDAGGGDYERSIPEEMIAMFLGADAQS